MHFTVRKWLLYDDQKLLYDQQKSRALSCRACAVKHVECWGVAVAPPFGSALLEVCRANMWIRSVLSILSKPDHAILLGFACCAG